MIDWGSIGRVAVDTIRSFRQSAISQFGAFAIVLVAILLYAAHEFIGVTWAVAALVSAAILLVVTLVVGFLRLLFTKPELLQSEEAYLKYQRLQLSLKGKGPITEAQKLIPEQNPLASLPNPSDEPEGQ